MYFAKRRNKFMQKLHFCNELLVRLSVAYKESVQHGFWKKVSFLIDFW